jgi:hypothetical protein
LAPPQSAEAAASAAQHNVDEVACQFLRLILPECGPYILWIKWPRGSRNEFALTIEELWQKEKWWDARGASVYHACASFKEAKHDPKGTSAKERRYGRTAHNVAHLKAFWLDIDAGPGKPYKRAQEASEALLAFCRTVGLPDPILVFSGNGLHAYWPLETTLSPDEWRAYAKGLKVLCSQHGLHADPSRTADVSSVLRTPGTHNRKNGREREVTVLELVGHTSWSSSPSF